MYRTDGHSVHHMMMKRQITSAIETELFIYYLLLLICYVIFLYFLFFRAVSRSQAGKSFYSHGGARRMTATAGPLEGINTLHGQSFHEISVRSMAVTHSPAPATT